MKNEIDKKAKELIGEIRNLIESAEKWDYDPVERLAFIVTHAILNNMYDDELEQFWEQAKKAVNQFTPEPPITESLN